MKYIYRLFKFFIGAVIKKRTISLLEGIAVIGQVLLSKPMISFKYNGIRLCLKNDNYVSVLYYIEDSLGKIYNLVNSVKICDTFIDVGANNGIFARLLLQKFPSATGVVVEASPQLMEVINKNLAEFSGVHVINTAVSDMKGVMSFYVNPKSQQTNSLDRDSVLEGSPSFLVDEIEKMDVQTETLDNLFESYEFESLDVLKVDIQGGEYDLLRGAVKTLPSTQNAFFEISFLDEKMIETLKVLTMSFGNYKVINDVRYGGDLLFFRK